MLGLVMMPILLGHLPKEEVGLWLLLGQSWAVMGILDLGFGVVLTRRIALAKGKSGGDPDTPLTDQSLEEIADLIAIGRRVYRIMAGGVLVVSCSLGFFYLNNLELATVSHSTVWIAWIVLCLCQALNVWSSTWTCLLVGIGYVGWDALLATSINTLTLLAQIAAVLFGGGLIALASLATAGSLIQRLIIRGFCVKLNPRVFNLKGKWNPAAFVGIPNLALRAWLSTLGTVLVFNTDGFFIASASGADNIPAYRAAALVVLNLHILTSAFAQSSSVFISQLWQAGEVQEARRIIQRNLRIGTCFTLCGGAAILFAGESLFNLWLGPSNYVGPLVLGVLVMVIVLEQQSFIISTSCRATDHEPFAIWMMLGGILKLCLALPLIHKFGLLGLALSTIIAQLATAHWFVAKHGLRRIGIPFSSYLRSVTPTALGVVALTCGFCLLAKYTWQSSSDLAYFLSVCIASALALMLSSWIFILDGHQRRRFLTMLGLARFIDGVHYRP
ncbi:lipopolysaccharide biosynthesis protein [Phragmitibacter flavus]|uniref:lipopolysaccharide biosynthesis protein n=1 Tax=Phragmitibacter flavus TaxID=2576071 RepID=UPI0014086165|nr:polysaccharide biosynthesis C-terminal domain-containing protein [Phragmitibacter flavus]